MSSWKRLSILPIIFFPLALAILFIFNLGENIVFNPPYLLLILNTIFLAGTGIAIAIVSAKSFLKEGSNVMLILGLATTIGGLAALIAGWAAMFSIDYSVAIYNIGIFLSGGLQVLSATIIFAGANPTESPNRKKTLVLSYSATIISFTTITALVVFGFSPTFFTASGPTLTRQWVISTAIAFFVISSVFFGLKYSQSKSRILYWYWMALVMTALGLFAATIFGIPNAVFNWMARIILYVASFYFLAGLLSAMKTENFEGFETTGISERWAEAFRSDPQQFKTLFSKMLNGFSYSRIIVNDSGKPADFVFLATNEAFERMTGLKSQEVIGKRASEVLPGLKNDPADWIGTYGKVALTGQSVNFKNYSVDLEKWYLVSAYSPRKGYFVAIFEDITERKKAEEKLAQSNQRIAEILESIQDNFYTLDRRWNFVYVNKQAATKLGKNPEDLIGHNIWEIFPKARATIFEKNYREAMDKREIRRFETRGAYVDVWVMVNVFPSSDGVSVWLTDITQRKKAEEALREVERDLNRAQAVGKIGSWRLDIQHNVLLWSDENHRIFGVPKGTPMTYEAFLNIVHPEDRDYVDCEWKAGLEGQLYDIEHRIIVDGKVKWVREKAELEFDKDGKLRGGFGTTQEITDFMEMMLRLEDASTHLQEYADNMEQLAKERAEKLKDAERLAAIGATAGMVGHDIRNPLQAITGDLYLVKTELDELPDHQQKKNAMESLDEIQNNIDYINKIVADLQDYARPLNPRAQETDITSVFDEMLTKNGIPKNVEVTVDVEDEARKVMADPDYLKRIVGNLTLNAVQAMPNGGKLTIRAYLDKRNGDTFISVRDTGVGIPEDVKPKLFTPMMTTKSKGQGFGLAVVKRMTEGLGGAVTFESQEGKGTTFIVRLPPQRAKR